MIRSRPNKGRFVSFRVILVCLFAHRSHSESLPSTWKYETSEAYRPFLLVKIEIRQCEKNYLQIRRMKVTERNLCQVPRNFFPVLCRFSKSFGALQSLSKRISGSLALALTWCGIVLLLLNVCYRQKCRNPCLLHLTGDLGMPHGTSHCNWGTHTLSKMFLSVAGNFLLNTNTCLGHTKLSFEGCHRRRPPHGKCLHPHYHFESH